MSRAWLLLAALALLAASPASAHVLTAGPPPLWPAPEPWAAVPMLLAGLVFATGLARLARRAGLGRAELRRKTRFFAAGLAVLAGATLSPLHALGSRSFTAHMIEHELIMLAAAPLFVLARPLGIMLWAFPAPVRRALAAMGRSRAGTSLWRILVDPLLATALQASALWIWHLPSLFDLALRSEGWHVVQHLAFFLPALLFWQAMLSPRRSPWTAAACLFATSLASGALGAFMAISDSPWYAPYSALGLAAFGLTPAEDQQLAGAVMWVPGGLFHALVAIAMLGPALRARPHEDVPL